MDNINKPKLVFLLILILMLMSCASHRLSPGNKRRVERRKLEEILREQEQANNTLAAKNLLSYIRLFLGTLYRKGGKTIMGVDCSGFVMTVFKNALHIDLPHNAALMYEQTTPIPIEEIKLGDLLFFENCEGKGISHVAIYLGGANFVHVSIFHGVTISSLKNDYYQQRFKGAHRVIDMEAK